MDTIIRKSIENAIISSSSNSPIIISDACATIEEYIFEKKQQRVVINPFFSTINQGSAFNYALQIALYYFQIQFDCVKIIDKVGILKSITFNN